MSGAPPKKPCVDRDRPSYRQLVTHRLHTGLLQPFVCARCRKVSLDPCGGDAKNQWLCPRCAS
jgi:hypothetical protein